MALSLKDRVLETTTTTGTGAISLGGTSTGYQAFSVVGDGNTTYYTIQGVDSSGNPTGEWEVGLGTYTLAGNTLSRDTVYASSNGGAKVVFSSGSKQVFSDLPAEQVGSGGGMVYPAAGIPNSTGSAWGTSYGTTGANSVVLRDANQNATVNCLFEGYTTQAAGALITLTAASSQNWIITGSGGQTIKLPDATTLPVGAFFTFNNNQSSGAITIQNNSGTTVDTTQSGALSTLILIGNSIAAGTWDSHDTAPANVSWSTNTFNYPGSITSATWNGATVQVNRGGTGATTLTGYVKGTGTTALTASATIPIADISATGTPSATTYLRGDATWATISGGSPAGATTQIQYNNSGAFGASSTLTFDSSTSTLATRLVNINQTEVQTLVSTWDDLTHTATVSLGNGVPFYNDTTTNINIGTNTGAGGSTTAITIGDANSATYLNGLIVINSLGALNLSSGLSLITGGSFTGVAQINYTGSTTSNQSFATGQTTGTFTLGGTAATGAITLGRSTATQTLNLATGASTTGNTKTVNIATGGLAGSTSNINIGSTANTSTTTVNGALSGTSTITGASIIANASTSASSNKGAISYGTLGYSDTDVIASFQSSSAGYNQMILQNTNAGTGASTNFNVSNNAGTATTNYGEFGINSSTFTGTGALNGAGNVYLGAASTDLVLATYGANAIHFVVNSGATDAATISSAGLLTANSFASSSAAITGGSVNSTPVGATTASTGAFTTLTASSTVTLSPASANVAISPTGTGTVAISPVGALTINPTAASTINNTSIGATTASTGRFTNVTTVAGTASVAPINLTSGTNLTTALAGAVEYDGTVEYFTPFGTSRSVTANEQIVILGTAYTLTSQTAAQKLFNATTNGAVTLAIGTYQFECFYSLSAMSATSGSFGFALGVGTAVIGSQAWWSLAEKGTATVATATATQSTFSTAANTTIATASVNTVGYALIRGTFRVTTAGTVIPQVSLGVAAAAVVGVGSYFKVSPISSTNAAATNITVGNWS